MSNYDKIKNVQSVRKIGFVIASIFFGMIMIAGFIAYSTIRIDVPAKHIAVLTKITGTDITNDDEIAPDSNHKGVQKEILTEGRYFYNPYSWDWNIYPMVEIPEGKMGIRVRLAGDSLPYGDFVAIEENQKGIVNDVLRPGRYSINAIVKDGDNIISPRLEDNFVEVVELHDPISIPAGFKGIVTNLSGPIPDNPNGLLVDAGKRGAQKETLEPGTYYMNPYMYRIIPIDCRSQRFNLAETEDMGFPSKDGFWVSLDGIVEFRIKSEKAAEIYVLYNESSGHNQDNQVDQEIIRKIIMPNARSFCRLRGSNNSGRDFIGGETRSKFQNEFQTAMKEACEAHGIEIVQALITRINPPQAIAEPVRNREVAHQKLKQFQEQKLQQEQEALLAIEKATIEQKRELVEADQLVIAKTTKAEESQQVAVTKAEELLGVAKRDFEAAVDMSLAILSRKKADAGVIDFENIAEASGWKRSVESMGSGDEYARFVLYQKLAPGFKSIMTNTANSPLMEIFNNFQKPSEKKQ
jgi:regulator of protease activity HflC (stomatin/prohibitin superfamily)